MITNEVKALLAKQFGIDAEQIHETDDLVSTLGADSLDLVEITMALESQYKIAIEDAEADAANTVEKLIALIVSKTTT